MGNPRKASLSIKYAGKDISKELDNIVNSFEYIDVATGESDSIQLDICNADKKWIKAWMPKKGDRVSAKILLHNWTKNGAMQNINCGNFTLDDLSFAGRPLTCTVGAVSVPQAGGFNSQNRTKTWEKTTIEEIAKQISQKAKVKNYYEAKEIKIASIEQNEESDCKFLFELCEMYGLAMKVYSNKICIFDEEKYEKKKAVVTLKETDLISWSYNTTISGTYTGVIITYTDPKNDKEYKVKVGSGNRILKISETADCKADAEEKAKARLRKENKKDTTMSVAIMANSKIIASHCVNVINLEKLSGKYYVDKIKTRVTGTGTTNMELTLHYVSALAKKKPIGIPEKREINGDYIIKNGDTLWGIAVKHLKSGSKAKEIYNLNKDIIENMAKKHGKTSSENGKWIWAGTEITLPE